MSDLGALRQQRDELNRQIAAAEEATRLLWNAGLDVLAIALRKLAETRGISISTSERKNVRTVTVGRVEVDLGYIENEPGYDYGPYLALRAGDLLVNFRDEVPSPAVMTALVSALLDEE